MIFFGDTETYSATPIKWGTYKYAEDSELLLGTYALDDGEVELVDYTDPADEERVAEFHYAMKHADKLVFQHSTFDRSVLRMARNGPQYAPPIERWHDTMVQALAHGLPGGLEKLCEIFKLPIDQQKSKEGYALIRLFCVPPAKNFNRGRATRHTHPEEWERFKEYAKSDIRAMRALYKKIPQWNYNGRELELWHLDQRINDRGFKVDVELAEAAVRLADTTKRRHHARTTELTHGEVEKTTQRDKLLKHALSFYGVELPDLRADTVERRLNDPDIPAPLRELLAIRLEVSLTSVSKYKALLKAVTADERLHGTLQFCGAARTGRWAGRVFQPQNLTRVPKHLKKLINTGITAIKMDAADLAFDNVMELLSACVRGSIIATPGKKLCVADLSNIEGRALAWLAGEEWKLQAFRDYDNGIGADLYILAYARSFGLTIEEVIEDDKAGGIMRQIGKVQELALGYQGAVGAFQSMAALYGVELSEERVIEIVRAWRHANSKIAKLWYAAEEAAILACLKPGEIFEAGKLEFQKVGNWLRMKLPSGRFICYAAPRVEGSEGYYKLTYMGLNPYTKQWTRLKTYGGKIVENATQGLARDVMAHNMPKVEAWRPVQEVAVTELRKTFAEFDDAGFKIVLTVHDEIITETPDTDEYDGGILSDLLAENPEWAPDLPLAAKGWSDYRYRKD